MDIEARHVVFKPLSTLLPEEKPVSITFFVTPDQFSACVILANYDQAREDAVLIPHLAACQATGVLAYREAASAAPRCIAGMTDITARKYLKGVLGNSMLSFTMPYGRYLEMEENVAGSFLQGDTWKDLIE
jgi:hypothetical protein